MFPHDGVSTELHKKPARSPPCPSPIRMRLEPDLGRLGGGDHGPHAARRRKPSERRFSERLGGLLGRISDIGARAEFPVAGLTAATLAAQRTALVGEAAHILPPIGAQGLNLGLRDAAALADCVADALAAGRRSRRRSGARGLSATRVGSTCLTRTVGVDLLSRSLLSGLLPMQAARGIVLHGLNALPRLRRVVMRLGLTPPTELPRLMRPATN